MNSRFSPTRIQMFWVVSSMMVWINLDLVRNILLLKIVSIPLHWIVEFIYLFPILSCLWYESRLFHFFLWQDMPSTSFLLLVDLLTHIDYGLVQSFLGKRYFGFNLLQRYFGLLLLVRSEKWRWMIGMHNFIYKLMFCLFA